MRIFIITQWFPPEHAPIGQMMLELASGLAKSGHKITVVTGFPNHPSGKIFPGYRKRLIQKEQVNGFNIWRVYLFTSPKRTFFRRILTSVTFIFSAFWAILLGGRCDVIISVLQPLTVGLFAPILKKIKHSHLIFNIQDIHPDALIELGIIENKSLVSLLRRIEIYSYRNADKITAICDIFKKHVISKGISQEKIEVIENWVNPDEIKPGNRINEFRQKYGIPEKTFVVLYSGTLGYVSGAKIILSTADRLRNEKDLLFVIVGDGPVLPELKIEAEQKKISNVRFIPFQERSSLNNVLSSADVALVTMQKGKGRFSMPSKVLAYMAAARPIIASVDDLSPTAEQIRRTNCGIIVPPQNADALMNAIMKLRKSDALRAEFGLNGRKYIENYLNVRNAIEKYENIIQLLNVKK